MWLWREEVVMCATDLRWCLTRVYSAAVAISSSAKEARELARVAKNVLRREKRYRKAVVRAGLKLALVLTSTLS